MSLLRTNPKSLDEVCKSLQQLLTEAPDCFSKFPRTMSGFGGKYARVNADETAIEYVTSTGSSVAFLDLLDLDLPHSYTDKALFLVRVNADEDGLEFANPNIFSATGHNHNLTDIVGFPNSYSGQAGKFLRVLITEDGIEFTPLEPEMGAVYLDDLLDVVCDLRAPNYLTLVTGNVTRSLTISGDSKISQDYTSSGSPGFAGLTIGSLSGVLKATAGVVSGSATYTDVGAAASNHNHDYTYLGIAATAADSDKLDGQHGSYYATRSFVMTSDGVLTVGTDKAPTIIVPFALAIVKAKVVVKTAPTGDSIIVDVNKNGTTIFTTQGNRPTIAAGNTADDSGTPDVTSLAEGDLITFDVDQVGSSTPGSDLTVELICTVS